MYLQIERGCRYFDDIIEKIASDKKYRLTFFNYYKILGERPLVKQYTGGLVKNPAVIEKLANDVFIVKKAKTELTATPPEEYYTWPGHFTLEALQASKPSFFLKIEKKFRSPLKGASNAVHSSETSVSSNVTTYRHAFPRCIPSNLASASR